MTEPKKNNIIAIASGKGGVGKTWLAVTLAHLFARSGRQALLFDGDIGLANVDVQLGLTPQRDLSSMLSGRHSLKEAVTHYAEGNFDIIAGRSGSASLAALPVGKLNAMVEGLAEMQKNYDAVILDLGAGIESHVQYLASLASRCVVVVTDEPTSLTDAYAFIKIASMHKPAPEMAVVVNMAATQKEGEATYQALNRACTNFLNLSPPLLGIIRRDNKVKDAIRSQKSLLIKAPHSTAATDAAALSIKLMQR
ncbi:MAG: MinD/ParA family protein [Pseudomonadota bacterium]|nr:MinD/ParA family protein [Pseudomonadota bacterium]MDE3036871.1 MinD/ParA family protein [Pseudomonadota bacterium]